ncbi:HNH endonuclease [Cellulomonas sp. P22]|uniref:HNH endonuclease n=1 Tax=Cellulomonas sp. P22 TaxID=3373189 RepID=UPI0037954005
METVVEREFRRALMDALREHTSRGDGTMTRAELTAFPHGDTTWRLIDQSRGIWNPRSLAATLSIVSSPTGPYADQELAPGVWRYDYRAGSVEGDNTKLRRAHQLDLPVILLRKIRTGVYLPVFPVSVIAEDTTRRNFTIALSDLDLLRDPAHPTSAERRYAERVVQQRLHQPMFRGIVLRAYRSRCAVCALKHPELLDAAHIDGDRAALGEAVVTNGMSLCKIHHTAYDKNFMGISPDYTVGINTALLAEVDGPMLKHGLQEMHGLTIGLPERPKDRPDRDRLARRFAEFTAAS